MKPTTATLHTDLLTFDDLADIEPPTVPHKIARLGKTVKIKVLSILGVQSMAHSRPASEATVDGPMAALLDEGIDQIRWALCEGLYSPAVTPDTVDQLIDRLTKEEAAALVHAILDANGMTTKTNAAGEPVNEVAAATADAFPAQPD